MEEFVLWLAGCVSPKLESDSTETAEPGFGPNLAFVFRVVPNFSGSEWVNLCLHSVEKLYRSTKWSFISQLHQGLPLHAVIMPVIWKWYWFSHPSSETKIFLKPLPGISILINIINADPPHQCRASLSSEGRSISKACICIKEYINCTQTACYSSVVLFFV